MIEQRRLGAFGPEVSALGLGCMGMSEFYGASDAAESLATLQHALDLGVNFLDTADMYGPYVNEELVGRAIAGRREQAFVATKFGFVRDPTDSSKREIDARPERVQAACEDSLRRLNIDRIDLYYLHRVDAKVPIEDTVGAMAQLIDQGKVRYLGLSEVSAATLERACAVHPITALQSEYSLWSREAEDSVLPACVRLGVGFVPYSPLGRGFLTGALRSRADLANDDYRLTQPRFSVENFALNLDLVNRIESLAAAKGCTPAQLALAWVLAQGAHIVPIPGTRHRHRLDENLGALSVHLATAEIDSITQAIPPGLAAGGRYPESMLRLTDR